MVLEPVLCPNCSSDDVVRHGRSSEGKQRYKCRNHECCRSTFIRDYSYRGYLPQVKQQITEMALNGSGTRDTARKTIYFSKSIWLHDVVIGLFINRYEFGVDI